MNERPPCLDNYRIDLVALAPERNVKRRYAIVATRDLFGAIIVELSWGRIGTRGGARLVSFAKVDQAQRFVAAVLRRRESAKARIGVAYQLSHRS